MKKIIVFSKTGRLRFVGHLDVMRTFQRALTRAGIQLAYSQGFNPHPLMAFAHPLTLGFSGQREIMEIITEQDMTDEEVVTKLGSALPEGLAVVSCRTGKGGKGNAMGMVQSATYRIALPEQPEIQALDWEAEIEAFLNQDEISVEKVGKLKGHKKMLSVDYKPYIYSLSTETAAEGGKSLLLFAACGSVNNVKPDLITEALAERIGHLELKYEFAVDRLQIFTGSKDAPIPLEDAENL